MPEPTSDDLALWRFLRREIQTSLSERREQVKGRRENVELHRRRRRKDSFPSSFD